MNILTVIIYLIACFVIACVLTVLVMMTRPIQTRGESKSWRTLLIFFILALGLPYGYNEFLTLRYGKDLKEAVEDGYASAPLEGPMRYFRIIKVWQSSATAIAVGTERESWGGTDSPVVQVKMVREKGRWVADRYEVLVSGRLNKDRFQFPPYW